MNRRFGGRRAVVTGASRGIGRAIAVDLAGRGAAVACASRDHGLTAQTVAEIRDADGEAEAFDVDVRSEESIQALGDAVLGHFGRVDILVNNAADTGDNVFRGFWETTPDEWAGQIDLNLNTMYALMKGCAPSMRENGGGLIVNLGSMRDVAEGLSGTGNRITEDVRLGAAYPTSKVAIFAMSTLLAQELAEQGIVVVTMNPGGAATESFKHNARRFGWDPEWGTPVWMPAKTVGYLATCDDPMAHAATYVDAVAFAQEKELAPPT